MQSKIEQQVMASVSVVYASRQLFSAMAFKCYALLASGFALWQFTWVHRVFENWAHVGFAGTWQFVSYALIHTHLPVQLALVVALATGISLAIDATRSLRSHQSLLLPQ